MSIAMGAEAMLAFSPDPWWGVLAYGWLGALEAQVSDPTGQASIAARLIGLEAHVRIPEAVLGGHHLLIGGGASFASADIHASAMPPLAARSTSIALLLATLSTTLVLHLIDRVELWLGVRAGFAIPAPLIVFTDRDVARWGAPWLSVSTGVGFVL
jgi:hypothetical protein